MKLAIRPRRDLPEAADGIDRFWIWLNGLMVYLAALALAATMALNALSDRWATGLSGTLTVEVSPVGDELADVRAHKVVERLSGRADVEKADVLESADVARLLEPWLGADVPVKDLPLPVLVDVRVKAGTQSADIENALSDIPGVQVDDHAAWLKDVRGLARAMKLAGFALVLLAGFISGLAVAAASKARLAVHAAEIEILHFIGATDGHIARQFEWQAFTASLRGGFSGLACAAITVFILRLVAGQMRTILLPGFAFSVAQLFWLFLLPVAITVIAVIVARISALRFLKKLP